jgi:hypothetical protein
MNEEFLVQTEEPSLIRNTHSKALLNKDRKALEEYKARKNFLLKVKNEDQETKDRIRNLEKDMSEIKSLLIEMIKSNGN